MSGSPQISQGVLNRLIASVIWTSYPQLTITAPFLGRDGISLAFEGNAVEFLPTLTGNVNSPEPFQMVTLTMHLLKTQGIAQLYESQRQTNAQLGTGTVRPDAATLGPYKLLNAAIESVRELAFSGQNAEYVVTCRATYPINSALWS